MAISRLNAALIAVFLCPASGLQSATLNSMCDPEYICQSDTTSAADETSLQTCQKKIPLKLLHTPPLHDISRPLYLFLIAPAYSGSSALQSLLLTSPRVTHLCSANVWMCEGFRILQNSGLLQAEFPLSEWKNPWNWTDVLEQYEKYWSEGASGAYIRVEKSTMDVMQLPYIMEHFADNKTQVAFIVLTRSPCSRASVCAEPCGHSGGLVQEIMLNHQFDGLAKLRRGGYKVLEVKYEELLKHPCDSSNQILEFLPQLETLNPGVRAYDKLIEKYPLIAGAKPNGRAASLLEFASARVRSGHWFGNNIGQEINGSTQDVLQRMGYEKLEKLPCK